jgi:N-acyl-D-amino-acid deacylase
MGEYTSHPRSYGTFPRAISRYALDLGLMPLEEVVRKMTSSPAQRIGLPDRGVLAKGMKADVVIFDPARIRDMATYDDSHRYPEGVRYVIVNGAITVEDGEHTKERAGQVLRHAPRVS